MSKFTLSAEQIKANYNKFINSIDKLFPSRAESLKRMYKELGEERLLFAPASTAEHFHNAIPGGYIDHVLRVMEFAIKEYNHYTSLGLDVSGFTKEELAFAAMHHDLGKLGFPGEGKESYIYNKSEWHRKNQGKEYEINEHIPFALVQDRSLFLLQSFQIPCSWNEWLGIRIHDGVYDDANKSYWISHQLKSKLRNVLPQILHNADIAASRFEFERWNKKASKLKIDRIENVNLADVNAERKTEQAKRSSKNQINEQLSSTFQDIFK